MRGLSSTLVLQAILLAAMVHLSTQTRYLNATDDICRLFKDGTELLKPGTCSESIICKNFESTPGQTCTGSKSYYSGSSGKCTASADTYCDTSKICKGSGTGYIGDSIHCANWYYCDADALLGKGTCTQGMYFDQVDKRCVYPKDTECAAKYEFCDIVPTNTPFRDEANCHMYFTCSSKKVLVTNTCENGLYYNVATGTCVQKKDVICENHPLPEEVCGNKKLAVRNKFVSDMATCRGYYFCRDLGSGIPDPDPIFQQCDENNFFNVERQACMPRESQKCDYDRCDGREDGFEVAEIDGCHDYIECVDGRETTPFSCADKYFDVGKQSCTETKFTYGACSS
ncbi:peritrophin-48 isoform X1 [Drosophila yakuba]|uniref:Uncharacterized protein, isoform A n=1 Tax=Drosophila yakuba TaxID=7245 RepID=B4PFS8_DROYA|nr:peritrophin-48 isoform X1 [Drosophila yakuba]EDW94227.2 uncharacterized protein Dyak_GE20161, isoform A [Drosophila yakuba]